MELPRALPIYQGYDLDLFITKEEAERIQIRLGGAVSLGKTTISEPIKAEFGRMMDAIVDAEPALHGHKLSELFEKQRESAAAQRDLHILKHVAEHRDKLFTAWQAFMQSLSDVFEEPLSKRVAYWRGEMLPPEEAHFTVELWRLLDDPRGVIDWIYRTILSQPYNSSGLFITLAQQLTERLNYVSGWNPLIPDRRFRHIFPADYDYSVQQAVETYLRDTPFYELFTKPVPINLSQRVRYSHTHILGGSGAGKTTLLKWLIAHDLYEDSDEWQPSVVVIDPHSVLTTAFSRADLKIDKRLILIDPRESLESPMGLNVFAANGLSVACNAVEREQLMSGVIQTFDYLFEGVFGAELTAKQTVLFRYLVRLLLTFPEALGRNAVMADLLRVLDNREEYQAAFDYLTPEQQDFFNRDVFGSSSFNTTREEIRYRLRLLVENPVIAQLFNTPERTIDFYELINDGYVILIDAAQDFLGDAAAIYGRVMISLILQAVLQRAQLPEEKRRATFLYVDEAHTFFDSRTEKLLSDCRKFNCGVTLAHHKLSQALPGLQDALKVSTAVKMVSGVHASDASSLAADMRTSSNFLMAQRPYHWATYVRGVTTKPISLPVQEVAKAPERSAASWAEFRERMRMVLSPPPASIVEPAPSPPRPAKADGDDEFV
jgi:hypothetical protein